jgi:hypothetical protein
MNRKFGVKISTRVRYFLVSKKVQTGSAAYPAKISCVPEFFTGSKAAGA